MTDNEHLLHEYTQAFFSSSSETRKKQILLKLKKLSKAIADEKLPRTGWWIILENPGPGKNIPSDSIYIGTKITLKADGTIGEDFTRITPTNHSAVIYWGTR
jgi:hypothetical protein